VRPATDKHAALIRETMEHYVETARHYREAFGSAGPLVPAFRPTPASAADAAETLRLLRGLAVFDGLNEDELQRVGSLCRPAVFHKGDVILRQGMYEAEVYMIRAGLLEVSVGEPGQEDLPAHTVVNLGEGQVVGEMGLIDRGPRSATVRCVSDTCTVMVMERQAFEALCAADHHIGLVVYRNLAADLSFKLRHRHLTRR
jgi:CRP-like cAMP-binding protein